MKVLVAGATGASGRPLIPALLAARHTVVGITTSGRRVSVLQGLGVDGVVVDVLDAAAVAAVRTLVRHDAVIDELISLPKDFTPAAIRIAAERDQKVRLEGGRNLHDAARASGVKRYLVQSTSCAGGDSRQCAGPSLRVACDSDYSLQRLAVDLRRVVVEEAVLAIVAGEVEVLELIQRTGL